MSPDESTLKKNKLNGVHFRVRYLEASWNGILQFFQSLLKTIYASSYIVTLVISLY